MPPAASSVPPWLILVLSSALISALVNVAFSAISKLWDHRREDSKEKKHTAHIYLDIALQLERFAQLANVEMQDISLGLWAYIENHDDALLQRLGVATFGFNPQPAWTKLPVDFAATVKAFPAGLSKCRSWIEGTRETWADDGDVWEFHRQRLAFYGRRACELAIGLRDDLGVKEDVSTIALANLFQEEIDKWRSESREPVNSKGAMYPKFIPELEMEFASRSMVSGKPPFLVDALRRMRLPRDR